VAALSPAVLWKMTITLGTPRSRGLMQAAWPPY